MNAIQQALDCLKNGNRTWEAMGFLQEAIKADELTQEVLRQLRAEREALEVRRADLAYERDAWLKSYEHKQAEVAYWEKRYIALLESVAKGQSMEPPVLYVNT